MLVNHWKTMNKVFSSYCIEVMPDTPLINYKYLGQLLTNMLVVDILYCAKTDIEPYSIGKLLTTFENFKHVVVL